MARSFLLKVSRLRLHMIKAKVANYKRVLDIKNILTHILLYIFSQGNDFPLEIC